MVPSFSFSGPHFERRRAEREPPGTYLEGKTKTTYIYIRGFAKFGIKAL